MLERLIEVKSAWKNAVVRAETRNFSTKKMFELAFRELLLCKEIRLFACEKDTLEALGGSKSFMQLPAVLHCNKLDISRLPWLVLHEHQRWLDVSDVIAWIEHYRPHHWHGPKQLEIAGSTVKSSLAELLDALKKVRSSYFNHCGICQFRRSLRPSGPTHTPSVLAAVLEKSSRSPTCSRTK